MAYSMPLFLALCAVHYLFSLVVSFVPVGVALGTANRGRR